jgi:hypothetical protein
VAVPLAVSDQSVRLAVIGKLAELSQLSTSEPAARYWNIYLPLGSTEGTYEIRIVTNSGGLLLTATGEATLVSGIASLLVDVNLASKNRGRCNLEIQKNTGEWNFFPLVLR